MRLQDSELGQGPSPPTTASLPLISGHSSAGFPLCSLCSRARLHRLHQALFNLIFLPHVPQLSVGESL